MRSISCGPELCNDQHTLPDFDIGEITKDSDGDGLTDTAEDRLKTNKSSGDTDGDGLADLNDSNPLSPSYNKCEWGELYQLVFDDLAASIFNRNNDTYLVIVEQLGGDNCPLRGGNHVVLNALREKPLTGNGRPYRTNNYSDDIYIFWGVRFEYVISTNAGEALAIVTYNNGLRFGTITYVFRYERNKGWMIHEKKDIVYRQKAPSPRYDYPQ